MITEINREKEKRQRGDRGPGTEDGGQGTEDRETERCERYDENLEFVTPIHHTKTRSSCILWSSMEKKTHIHTD